MTLDDATKEKYCDIYRAFTKSWTNGPPDWDKTAEVSAALLTDDFVFSNASLPKIEGKEAFMASLAGWANIISMMHGIQAIWCTDDGWVHVIYNLAMTSYNADKSKIVSKMEPGMSRIHINEEGKIDTMESYWDTSKFLTHMA
jgi:hypothetical protein